HKSLAPYRDCLRGECSGGFGAAARSGARRYRAAAEVGGTGELTSAELPAKRECRDGVGVVEWRDRPSAPLTA
ncbi:MAG: hypothetical protein ACLPX8_27880, partial [Bryobacteraceae bacterium]